MITLSKALSCLCLIAPNAFAQTGVSPGPEAGEGGAIALVEEGDIIDIDIPNRTIELRVTMEELAHRRAKEEARGRDAFTPKNRERYVSAALQAYAALTTSADTGAVRDLSQLKR